MILHLRRRRFLGAVGAALLAAGAVAARSRPGDPPRATIRHRLAYLTFPEAVLDRFLADHAVHGDDVADPEMPLHLRFLCSTTFFATGADERVPLAYAAYHDPYASPCRDPLRERP